MNVSITGFFLLVFFIHLYQNWVFLSSLQCLDLLTRYLPVGEYNTADEVLMPLHAQLFLICFSGLPRVVLSWRKWLWSHPSMPGVTYRPVSWRPCLHPSPTCPGGPQALPLLCSPFPSCLEMQSQDECVPWNSFPLLVEDTSKGSLNFHLRSLAIAFNKESHWDL